MRAKRRTEGGLSNPVKERAILVAVSSASSARVRNSHAGTPQDNSLDELEALACTAGAEIVGRVIQTRVTPDAAFFIGRGKVQQLREKTQSASVSLLIFDDALSPTQQRNLEQATGCRVIDRTQVILAIFAQRARSREGKLQVELAQLNYLRPRLTGRGVDLSRLGGGIGTRGPGETKLEMDRRRIVHRIAHIRRALENVRAQRERHRAHRRDTTIGTVSLVGYTNAGKSTLFNALTQGHATVSPQLFSTLDPTLRRILLPSNRLALLSDTVGFIRKLHHMLVSAFHATLEEVTESDLILHVVDRSNPDFEEQEAAVEAVLEELRVSGTPILKVYNKLDRLALPPPNAANGEAVYLSALTGEGLPQLLHRIDQMLVRDSLVDCTLLLPHAQGRVLSLVHQRGHLLEEEATPEFIRIRVQLPQSIARQLSPYLQ